MSRLHGILLVLTLCIACECSIAATFTVNSTQDACDSVCDASHCTLCEAIQAANDTPNIDANTPDEIHFAIAGDGPHVIMRDGSTMLLPDITDPVIIDGFTQPGSQPNTAPMDQAINTNYQVILSTFGFSERAFKILSGGTTIRGLVIQGFQPSGIIIEGPGENIVAGNFIGASSDGVIPIISQFPIRGERGIEILGSPDNRIGGPLPEDRNLIAGFRETLVLISGAASTNNVIAGNFIGPDADGTGLLTADIQEDGVVIEEGATNNLIGGFEAGARNLITGNDGTAIMLDSNNNRVSGNFLGSDRTGTDILENGFGIDIRRGVSGTIIGGTEELARNVLGGFTTSIDISDDATGNHVLGNLIGTDPTGTNSLDTNGGIFVGGSNNTIGGPQPGARNVIVANGLSNIEIRGATGTVVQGNYIGVNIQGEAFSSGGNRAITGIQLASGATDNLIGGPGEGEGNVISGNGGEGIELFLVDGNTIQGNIIGADPTGTMAIPNTRNGIAIIQGDRNRIGGPNPGEGNLISGNDSSGVSIAGFQSDTTTTVVSSIGNVIQGNKIGVNMAGDDSIPNGGGIRVFIGNDNLIGGATQGSGNLISGNQNFGVAVSDNRFFKPDDGVSPEVAAMLQGASSNNNVVSGNYIGVDASGMSAIPNMGPGIELGGFFGGRTTVGGPEAGARNVVSGNTDSGILIERGPHVIQGNYVGTNAAGAAALPNGFRGIAALGAEGAQVLDNVVSGNADGGIIANRIGLAGGTTPLTFYDPANLVIQGNRVGTDASGDNAIPNGDAGIVAQGTRHRVVGNQSSGNGSVPLFADGIRLEGGVGHIVQGNIVGTNSLGTIAIPNMSSGIIVQATGCLIGGSTEEARNLTSGNGSVGLFVNGHDNIIFGNYSGTDSSGTIAIPNGNSGFILSAFASRNTVGGPNPGEGNLFSGNPRSGILQFGGDDNVIQGNFIGSDINGSALPNLTAGIEILMVTAPNAPLPNNTAIGGANPGEGNLIAFNGGPGITIPRIADLMTKGHTILGNRIHSNSGLGIDLEFEGVLENDLGPPPDTDEGNNNSQNFPDLTSVNSSGGNTTIGGTLNSIANTMFRVEFFSNSECDPSGNGEGQTFLGFDTVPTDGSGLATINAVLPVSVAMGDHITSTATRLDGAILVETSEFSDCFEVTDSTGPTSTPTPGDGETATPTPTTEGGETPTATPILGADLDGDMQVNSIDLILLLRGLRDDDTSRDVNGDGTIDQEDLLDFSTHWME